MTEYNLNKHTARLLMNEPFWAALSRNITKMASTGLPTAGVRVNPDTAQFEMLYNPEYFAGLTDKEKLGVIKHELFHLSLYHVTGRVPEGGLSTRWNICTDLAINSHLRGELPEGALFPEQEGAPWEDLPWAKSAEWYMKNLVLPKKKSKGEPGSPGSPGEGDGQGEGNEGSDDGQGREGVGSHDGWKEVGEETRAIARERLRNNLKKAAMEAAQHGWGTVPADCRREIMQRLTTRVDWRKVLRYFVKTSQRANKRSTMKVINRRYPYVHPGRRTQRMAQIAISIDQSGSVSDDMLNSFFNELAKLAKLASFTVIPFDTRVAEDLVYEWKKGETRKWKRVMHGGTCFNAPTDYVNKHNFDGHIVLTDLMAPKPKRSNCQRMWLTTKQYAARPYFKTNERVLAIDV